MEEKLTLIVNESFVGLRLDQFLSENIEYSRSYIQKLIKNNKVTINGNPISKSKVPVSFNDEICIFIPPPTQLDIKPENMDLDILYEDDDLLVVNKPKDMVVHPAAGHYEHTLVNGLLYHCKGNLSSINGVLRPGIVHRIDKDTTGALVVCKNDIAHQSLSQQLSVHSINRIYNAITCNNFTTEEGRVETFIGRNPKNRKKMAVVQNEKDGKLAITNYRVLDHLNNKYNWIECKLETGRTHQIRVHMSHIMHPILGDDTYGTVNKQFKNLIGQTLHAKTIGFIHPKTNQYIEINAPLPQYFVDIINSLKNNQK